MRYLKGEPPQFRLALRCSSPSTEFLPTAVVKVDQTRIERDGTKIDLKVVETSTRDSHGRLYRDASKLELASRNVIVATIRFLAIHLAPKISSSDAVRYKHWLLMRLMHEFDR
jgi:hypothetical protein